MLWWKINNWVEDNEKEVANMYKITLLRSLAMKNKKDRDSFGRVKIKGKRDVYKIRGRA